MEEIGNDETGKEGQLPPEAAQLDPADQAKLARLKRWFHLDRQTPVTTWLVGTNIAVFVAMALWSGFATVLAPSVEALIAWGALYAPSTFAGQYWRMLTSVFLHGGLLHIAVNMYVLWYVGPLVERLFGSRKFAVIYLLAGLGGSINTLMWTPAAVAVGASGAIFGIFGGLLAFFQTHKSEFPPGLFQEKMRGLLVFLLLNLALGLVQPNIGLAAHVGGLVIGYAAALAVMPRAANDWRWHWLDTMRAGTIVLIFAVLMRWAQAGAFDLSGQLFLVRALDMISSRQYQQALPLLSRRIELAPYDVRAYIIRAAAYTMLNEQRNAIADCNYILSQKPDNLTALVTRADAYGKIGQYQKSIDDIDKALKKKGNLAGAYTIRAWDEYALGRFKQASSDYEKAIQLQSELVFIYNNLAYAKFACADYRGTIEAAHQFLNKTNWHDDSAPYAVIIAALANRALADEPAAGNMLDKGLENVKQQSWQHQILDYLKGRLSAAQLESLACDSGKMTEAKTYIGLNMTLSGQSNKAKAYFAWVSEHGNKQFLEYPLAKVNAQ